MEGKSLNCLGCGWLWLARKAEVLSVGRRILTAYLFFPKSVFCVALQLSPFPESQWKEMFKILCY